jgi:DNA-binding NarL/FixJ family response regulator
MAYRFLVVDDTNFMRKMASDCLRQFGYEVAGEATDGKEAIRLYEELMPDVVMMDLTMPEMNGTEAIKAILGINPKAVILVCTASNEKELVLEAMDAGAKGYLMKPFNPTRLHEVIRKYAEPYLIAQPVTETEEPVSETEEPVSETEEPVSETEEPVTKTEELVSVTAEHALGTMESVSEESLESPGEEPASQVEAPIASYTVAASNRARKEVHNRGNTRLKSFVSSFMCKWQENKNGETVEYSVVCTESEDRLVIERTDDKAEKQVIPFTIQGFRELADWLDNHLGAQEAK